ncbi:MAG: hypothetical protein KDE69_06120, partial [Burkholderiaceae bacterium]|nr:hypothetical protein [Burkholderiaceae bacterium]
IKLAPQAGHEVGVVVLAAVAVFETLGPPLVAFALRFAREVPDSPKGAVSDGAADSTPPA